MAGLGIRLTADTNVLIRAIVGDDPDQAASARALLSPATTIAIPIPVLCESIWVSKRTYGRSVDDIASAISAIADVETVVTDRPIVEAGLLS